MGLLFSMILSYAGALEAIECMKHILAGMLPDSDPDFSELVEHYTRLLNRASSASAANSEWAESHNSGQGYLCLTEDKDGSLSSATVKYYDGSKPDSAAILFSTKISSFGQDSVDSNSAHANNDYASKKTERYTTSTTKTILTNTSDSINIGQRDSSTTPSYENVSDPTPFSGNSFGSSQTESHDYHTYDDQSRDDQESVEVSDSKEKLTWHYRPRTPVPQALPEIHLQQIDGAIKPDDSAYSEDFLRSLDGIKYRPLQRTDQSGRRRSYKKRHSSSSTSSRESRASREEELKIFTSLEEAEFELMGTNKSDKVAAFGSTSNLAAHSNSRSRSRENSKERRNEWSTDESVDSAAAVESAGNVTEVKPRLKDLPKLGSFEEEKVEETSEKPSEVIVDEEEEVDDFWGSSGE